MANPIPAARPRAVRAAIAGAAISLAVVAAALAQSGGGFQIAKSTLAPGESRTAAGFQLNDAAGQSDAGTLVGGAFVLHGGFFAPAPAETNASVNWAIYD